MIEDAAHAIGTEYRGRRIGGLGNLTAFSFYATKNITSGGEGGAITTDDPKLAEQLAIMSLHGISKDAWKRYSNSGYQHWDIIYPGFKYNMFDLQAAVARPQLKRIDEFWQRRVAIKARFDAAFVNGISLYSVGLNDVHVTAESHPGASVIPAVLALSEWKGLAGREMIAAMVAGYVISWIPGFDPNVFNTFR